MADPITIITTLHGLAEKLVKSIKSGQDAAKAQEILRLVGELQTEYFALQSKMLQLERENFQLTQRASSSAKPEEQQQPADNLPEESEKMLVAIANETRGRLTKDMVIRHFGLAQAKGDYFFDQLLARKYVHTSSGQMGVGWFYHATKIGREYLAKRDLL
jgi:hypothetical protein